MFKGKTEIILTDVNTGEVERYEEENMLTGALNSFYKGNPYGLLSHAHSLQAKFSGTRDASLLTTAGGVLLFPNAITEDVNHLYEPLTNDTTAYASNDSYDGTDAKRGAYSPRESHALPNGYQFVWNFSTAQGNGQISCVCLTHARGAKNYYKGYADLINYAQTDEGNTYCYGELGIVEHPVARKIKTVLAFNNDQLVVIDNNNKIGIIKYKANKLNFDSFATSANFDEKMSAPSCNFICDGSEFYTITATATAITWQRYNINCEQIATGSWSFSGTNFYKTNNRYLFAKNGNYIYIPNTSLNAVYKCNIVNTADVTEIAATSPATSYGECMRAIGSEVFTRNGVIGADNAFRSSTSTLAILPFRRVGVWLLGYGEVNFSNSNQYNSLGRQLQTNYLATINNLNKTVNKTSDKSMKIVYTLTEVE